MITKLGNVKDYLPVDAPLLYFLTADTDGPTELHELRRFQEKQGLPYSVLEDVEVCEIICGISTTEEKEKFHEWITEQHLKNQENFDSGVISMDFEDVKALIMTS